uniref:THAP-type domain-containing protein n=1 Tax=Astatotilapia calliptera TaxID=8154 RepID=A0A3P8QH58_ASTCA
MVRTCCVLGCNVRSYDRHGNKVGLSFYAFPTWKQHEGAHVSDVTKRRRLAWIAAVRRVDIKFCYVSRYQLVCSRHFHSGKPAYEMDQTNPDWVPTLHMGHSETRTSHSDRHRRRTQRQQNKVLFGGFDNGAAECEGEASAEVTTEEQPEMDTTEEQHHNNLVILAEGQICAGQVEAEVTGADAENIDIREKQTEDQQLTNDCVRCVQSRAEINRLLEENRKLKSKLDKTELNENFLKGDTEKVKYYTGFTCFAIFMSVLENVKVFLPASKKLSHFQMLLLTLMRLRLDLPVQHLSYLFNVSHKTLSSVFSDTIDVLYARFGILVHWPERHCLQATMPPQFTDTFGNRVAIIVDCFEIRTERPSNLKACAQTYSHYKGTHTMKYLIGITPQGAISFISKGWGGRASDKHITKQCGILNKLLPGDVVLADRGFDIRDAVGMMCAEVKIPAFTRGFCQLDAKDIENTRAIAHLRIHVERVIGSLRNKFKMLHTTMPIRSLLPCEGEDVTFLDKIVRVCCVLVNMCPSVVVKPGTIETCTC